MRDDYLRQPFRQIMSPMFAQDEHVGNPGKRGVVSNDAREPNLMFAFVNSKRQRVFDRARDDFAGTAGGPVGFVAEVVMNQIQVEPRAISADRVITAAPDVSHRFDHFARSGRVTSDGFTPSLTVGLLPQSSFRGYIAAHIKQ